MTHLDSRDVFGEWGDFHYVLSWDHLDRLASESCRILKRLGMSPNTFTWTEPGATHRPFHVHKEALKWIHQPHY